MSIYIKTLGEGPDLVLLHGWAMHSGIWDPVVEKLAQHFRLHLVDLPGYGYSSECKAENLDEMVKMLSDSFSGPVDVCGWSLGGSAAMLWALTKPQQIRRLILVSASPCFVKNGNWPGVDLNTIQNFANLLEKNYTATVERFLILQLLNAPDARQMIKMLRAKLFERGNPEKASLRNGLLMLMGTDLRERTSLIQQPAMLMYGDRDTLVPYRAGEWLKANLTQAEFKLFPDCGHLPFLSDPRFFSQTIIDFCNG